MKIEQATIGKRVAYTSRTHRGVGKIEAIMPTAKGPYFRVADKAHPKGGVAVRLSQISAPARKAA